jgi:hypothetical protein
VARVESTNADGLPRNSLDTSLVLTSSVGVTRAVVLGQESPGAYVGIVSGLQEGAYEVQINQSDPSSGLAVASQAGGIVVPYADEYAPVENGPELAADLLRSVAQLGEGRSIDISDPSASLTPTSVDQPRRIALWPWLLTAAVLLFPIDVALRRLNLGWRAIRRLGKEDANPRRTT